MTTLELLDQWAIAAGLALVVCGLVGVLSSVDFPGLVYFKTLDAFPLLRIGYSILTGLVGIAFLILFFLITVNISGG